MSRFQYFLGTTKVCLCYQKTYVEIGTVVTKLFDPLTILLIQVIVIDYWPDSFWLAAL